MTAALVEWRCTLCTVDRVQEGRANRTMFGCLSGISQFNLQFKFAKDIPPDVRLGVYAHCDVQAVMIPI